ncbi:MAG: hypothetical protein JXL97_02790 [Bacteroidales bacterium]|nr:hypothetical protein [Bacteroidales bacterium]
MFFSFLIPIHIKISKKAFDLSGIKLSKLQKAFFLFANGIYTDVFGVSSDWHFDSLKNFEEIIAYWNKLETKISQKKTNIFKLGNILHIVHDFYAHSNYVELYVEYCKKTNKINEIQEIIPFPISLSNKEFLNNYLKPKLFTGEFNLKDFLMGKDMIKTHKKKLTHHNDIAKDSLKMGKNISNISININTFELAFDAATKHSILILNKFNQ